MAAWEWIALGLGLLVLIQLVALQYARRMGSEDGDAAARPTPGAPTESNGPREGGSEIAEDDQVVCKSCGTANDIGFSFCRECVSPIA